MKIIKKYEYKLSEKTLDKDIEKFIKHLKEGDYSWGDDDKEGVKLTRAYFRMIEDEFKKQNFNIAKNCYQKLMFPLLGEEGYGYFNMDIVGALNFEKFIGNYFICLIKLHTTEELFNEYIEYLKAKEDYYFETAETTIMEELSEEELAKFKKLLFLKVDTIKEDDYAMHDVLTFLLDITKKKERDETTFMKLAVRFAPILGYADLKEFLEDYNNE